MSTRTKKRSRSGAQEACPHCGKKLSGAKGLKMHLEEVHADRALPKVGAGSKHAVAIALGREAPK